MRLGTTGFVGQRLKEAREARGLSGVDLADMLGVKPQTIYAYQGGDATPSPQRRSASDLASPSLTSCVMHFRKTVRGFFGEQIILQRELRSSAQR